jgi:hypothetical protein
MNRQSLPAVLGGTVVTRAGCAAGCGGAGSLAALAFVHRLGAPAVAAGAVTAAVAASAVKSLSGAIEAVGNLLTALIRVRADAKATVINAKLRADLARAGLDPGRTSTATLTRSGSSGRPLTTRRRRCTGGGTMRSSGRTVIFLTRRHLSGTSRI